MENTALPHTSAPRSAPHAGPQSPASQPPAHWNGVFAMTLCVFALIASEFMPVSLLTPMSADLHVTEGMTGQGIAISGAFAVFTSLFIAAIAGNTNRKSLLLGLTAVMAISGAIIAAAPTYTAYMLGRALIGVVVGGFWSMSAATAIRLVPAHQVPRALAIFNSGNALATVIAAPAGSYLGTLIGWRGAFYCLVPVALLALAWQWFSLPTMPVPARPKGSGNVFVHLKRPVVALGMLAAGVFFSGQFTLFTYVRPFLETVTHVDAPSLSLILLAIGVAGFAGTMLIGAVLKRAFHGVLVAIPALIGGDSACADRPGAKPGGCRGASGTLGTGCHGGAGGMVELDHAHVSTPCRSRRRPDGGDCPDVDRAGLHGRRHPVRYVRLSEHARSQRCAAVHRRRTRMADGARRR